MGVAKKKKRTARKFTFDFLLYAFIYAAVIQGSASVMRIGIENQNKREDAFCQKDIWRLGHLAVGTFFGQGLKGAKWAVGTWNKWLLGHLMVSKFATRGQMAVETFCS